MIDAEQERYVDRSDEVAAFEALLRQGACARILVVHAQSGAGKSTLLRQLRKHCRTRGRVPVTLLDLKDLREAGPLGLVRAMHRDLSPRLTFPGYDALVERQQRAGRLDTLPDPRDLNDFPLAGEGGFGPRRSAAQRSRTPRVRVREALTRFSQLELRNLYFDNQLSYEDLVEGALGEKVIGIIEHFENRGSLDVLIAEVVRLRPDLAVMVLEERPARDIVTPEQLVDAFFDDVRRHAEEQPVALLVDSFEQAYDPAARQLAEWFEVYLFERLFLGPLPGPRNLVLTIAGTRVPPFHDQWPAEDCERVITHRRLAPLDGPLFAECLRRQVPGIADEDIEPLRKFYVERDAPLVTIISFAQSFAGRGGRRT